MVIEKTGSGGKNVVIERPSDDFGGEPNGDDGFLNEIDEIFFRFRDVNGQSPDVKFVAGTGHSPPYLPPDDKGNFVTPQKETNPRTLFSQRTVSARYTNHKQLYNPK